MIELVVSRNEVTEHQQFWFGDGGNAADVFGGGVSCEQMFPERRAVRDFLQDALDARNVQRLVHQHVAAFGEFRELRVVFGVAGEHDRAIRGFELVGEVVRDRRMRRAKRRDGDVVRLQHDAIGIDVFSNQKFSQIGTAFVRDTGLDVELVYLPIGFRHGFGALGAE